MKSKKKKKKKKKRGGGKVLSSFCNFFSFIFFNHFPTFPFAIFLFFFFPYIFLFSLPLFSRYPVSRSAEISWSKVSGGHSAPLPHSPPHPPPLMPLTGKLEYLWGYAAATACMVAPVTAAVYPHHTLKGTPTCNTHSDTVLYETFMPGWRNLNMHYPGAKPDSQPRVGKRQIFPHFSSIFYCFLPFFLKFSSLSSSIWSTGWASPPTLKGPG